MDENDLKAYREETIIACSNAFWSHLLKDFLDNAKVRIHRPEPQKPLINRLSQKGRRRRARRIGK